MKLGKQFYLKSIKNKILMKQMNTLKTTEYYWKKL